MHSGCAVTSGAEDHMWMAISKMAQVFAEYFMQMLLFWVFGLSSLDFNNSHINGIRVNETEMIERKRGERGMEGDGALWAKMGGYYVEH